MAHFARLDENNTVLNVIKVNDEDVLDSEGNENEEVGIAFCKHLFGGIWKQTSYNDSIRGTYAIIGGTYDPVSDTFIHPQPFASWVWNTETFHWEPPVPRPEDGVEYFWNETELAWEASS